MLSYIWIVNINSYTRRSVKRAKADVSILLAACSLTSSDLKNSIKGLDLFRNIVNGMLHLIANPEIASVVHVPVVGPKEEYRLVLVVCLGVVPVFHPRTKIERDTVKPVRRLRSF